MCLAVPVQIERLLEDDQAVVSLNGVETTISTALIDDVHVGNFVILHVGYALEKLDEQEAQATLALFARSGGERSTE